MVPSSEFGFRKGKREQRSEHWEESSDEQLRAEFFNNYVWPAPKTDPVIMLVRGPAGLHHLHNHRYPYEVLEQMALMILVFVTMAICRL